MAKLEIDISLMNQKCEELNDLVLLYNQTISEYFELLRNIPNTCWNGPDALKYVNAVMFEKKQYEDFGISLTQFVDSLYNGIDKIDTQIKTNKIN